MLVTSYIDVAGSRGQPMLVLGCYVGKLGQLNHFDRKWRRMLEKAGLTYFHAMEMHHSKGEFKDWTLDQKEALIVKMEKLTNHHTLFGFTVRLDDTDFKGHYLPIKRPKKVAFDSRYGVNFRSAISFLPATVERALGRTDFELHVVVEDGDTNIGAAPKIFHEIKKDRKFKYAPNLGDITIGEKKKYPGLQAADLVAFLAQRYERKGRADMVVSPTGDVHQELGKARKSPIYRLHSDKKILADLRDQTIAEKEARRQFWREARRHPIPGQEA
ncbi:MAG: DUF3800 domain-containing protein [Alphaproteobacteria bacterium]